MKGVNLVAFNIHYMPWKLAEHINIKDQNIACYGACLRSSVMISSYSTDHCLNSNSTMTVDQHLYQPIMGKKKKVCSQLYIFDPVKIPYVVLEWISQVWFKNFRRLKFSSEIIFSTLKLCFLTSNIDFLRQGNMIRDPYKEWFDHACEGERRDFEHNGFTLCSSCLFSKHLYPSIVRLSHLRNICMNKMTNSVLENSPCLGCWEHCTIPEIGWTQSLSFDMNELAKMAGSVNDDKCKGTYVGGVISISTSGAIYHLCDESCQLPFTPISNGKKWLQSRKNYNDGSFAIIKVQSATVTSFYLGHNNKKLHNILHLPPLHAFDANVKFGACQLICLRGHIFLISIQMHYYEKDIISSTRKKWRRSKRKKNEILQMGGKKNAITPPSPIKMFALTKLIHWLGDSKSNKVEEGMYIGRLVCLNWAAREVRGTQYTGCTMTLSFAPTIGKMRQSYLESNQSINIELIIPVENSNMLSMRNAFSSFGLRIDNLPLSCAWRLLAEQFCPMICATSPSFCTQVLLPTTAKSKMQRNKLSYMLDLIQLHVEDIEGKQSNDCARLTHNRFCMNSLNSSLLRSGMTRRDKKITGKLTLGKGAYGLPSIAISTLIYRLLHNLTQRQSVTQLTWRIPNARITSLEFCAVRIQCKKCFEYLKDIKKNYSNINHPQGNEERNFWNLPLPPIADSMWKASMNGNVSSKSRTHLSCPNGCNYHHASAKWELSGVLDDGTGSAIFYAEQTAALMLLGAELDTNLVEEAAWRRELGIVFHRGIALGASIKNTMKNRKSRRSYDKYNVTNEDDRLHDFSIVERAKIELLQYCIDSECSVKKRKIDFVCRCKKIPKKNHTFNQVKLSSTSALGKNGKAIQLSHESISVPQLELKLVDCINSLDATEAGWFIRNSL